MEEAANDMPSVSGYYSLPMMSSSLFAGHQLPWTRFWCRRGEEIAADYAGAFLRNPESDGVWRENTHLLRTKDTLPAYGPIVLSGEPGMGKTTEFRALLATCRAEAGIVLERNCATISDYADFRRKTFESPLWQSWTASSDERLTLFVDSIDEGLTRAPVFLESLTEDLREAPVQRLRLVLACRSMEWPVTAELALFDLWQLAPEKPPVLELCPLRQVDARAAAEAMQLDAEAFLKATYDAQVTPLAARPLTLSFLLREFQNTTGAEWTHRGLYESGSRRLVGEHDAARASRMRRARKRDATPSDDARYSAAQRLAATALLTGKSSFNVALSIPINISDRDLPVSGEDELAALETALFTSLTPDRFAFFHQTVAECLASQFLRTRPLIQLRKLLCRKDHGKEHAVPQLAELAAWVAGYRPDFFEHLLRVDPGTLLRSDVAQAQLAHKEALVGRLLDGARREEIFHEHNYRPFYGGLCHPGLADQLRPVLRDKSEGGEARALAFNIAEVCALPELCEDLQAVLCDSEEPQSIREAASDALCESVPSDRLEELVPLALGQVGTDPNDSIRGDALRKLVPAFWSVRDCLAAIRGTKKRGVVGSYHMFVSSELPRFVTEADVVPLLSRMKQWSACFDHLNDREALAEKAFTMALDRLHEPAVASAMVDLWLHKRRNHHCFSHDHERSPVRKALVEPERRRAFARLILNDPRVSQDDVSVLTGGYWGILEHEDFAWLLERVVEEPEERRFAWLACIQMLAYEPLLAKSWELFIQTWRKMPALQQCFPAFSELHSKTSRRAKAQWLKRQRMEKRWKEHREPIDAKAALQDDVQKFEDGATWVWVRVVQDLALKPGDCHYHRRHHSCVEALPGWETSTNTEREKYRRTARAFLLHQDDGYAEHGARTTYADPGVLAIKLLHAEIDTDEELKAAVRERWIDALTGWSSDDEPEEQDVFTLAYRLNRDASLVGLRRELKDDENGHGHLFAIRRTSRCWNADLAAVVSEFVAQSLNPKSIESGLAAMAELDLAASEACAKQIIARYRTRYSLEASLRLKAALAIALAKAMPNLWAEAFEMVQFIGGRSAKEILLEMVDHVNRHEWRALTTRSEEELANFFLLTERLFKPQERPGFQSGRVTRNHQIADLRGHILNALERRATEAACTQFLRLIRELPADATWLRWRYQRALNAKRRAQWHPPTAKDLTALLAKESSRWIDDEDDLRELVLESLERIQHRLTKGSPPAVSLLWNYDGAGTRRTNFRPRDEEDFSDFLKEELDREIGPLAGVVIFREVQPRRGKKTDIHIEAICEGRPTLKLIIEVKGCWNREIPKAVETQLVGDYLRPFGHTHGIFLVGWFWCDKWTGPSPAKETPLSARAFEEAQSEISALCASFDGVQNPEQVVGLVLDARHPD